MNKIKIKLGDTITFKPGADKEAVKDYTKRHSYPLIVEELTICEWSDCCVLREECPGHIGGECYGWNNFLTVMKQSDWDE